MNQTTRPPTYFTLFAFAVGLAAAPDAAAQGLTAFDAATDWAKFPKLFPPMNPRSREAVTVAPDGVTIALDANAGTGPVGTQAEATLRGEFQVEVRYEVLALADAFPGEYGPRFGLLVDAGSPVGSASLNRGTFTKGQQARLSRSVPGKDSPKYGISAIPTQAKTGRLALRRTGTEVVGLSADAPDGPLTEFARLPFTDKPVRAVRMSAADAGQAGAALKVRLHGLQVRTGANVPAAAEAKGPAATVVLPMPASPAVAAVAGAPTLPGRPDVADPTAAAAPATEAPLRGQWWLLVVVVLGVLVVGVLLGRRWLATSSPVNAPSES